MPSTIGLKTPALRTPETDMFEKFKQLLIKRKVSDNKQQLFEQKRHIYIYIYIYIYICTLRKWWGSPGQTTLKAMLAVE